MFTDVIVTHKTLGSFPSYLSYVEERAVREAVAELGRKVGLTPREAAAVIAQSYGIRCSFESELVQVGDELAPIDSLTWNRLYAAWRGDKITDQVYRAELIRRIDEARQELGRHTGHLTKAGFTLRSGLLEQAERYARGADHRRVGELVGEALAGMLGAVA